ncbi:MAG: oligosaccharide flippase family protein [Steroidobacter sp.]
MTETALRGITWNVVVIGLTRVLSLAGQVVLGWLLIPEQFGVYALAVSLSAFATILRSGGIQQVAVQRGADILDKSPLYYRYALAFNCITAVLLLCIAMPYFIRRSAIALILAGMAISIPLATAGTLYKVHLTVSHRFREISLITFWSALIWQTGVVVLAMLGLGAASFALPPVLQSIYESYAYKKRSRQLGFAIAHGQAEKKDYLRLLYSTQWIMLSSAMLSLATTGDYFAVGMLTDAATVGVYFFSFQLIAAISIPMTSAFESVLPALLTRQAADHDRQTSAYIRLLRQVLVVTLPLALLVSVSLPLVMRWLWQDRWEAAIVPAQWIAMCIPAWLVVTIVRSVLESKGMWRLRFAMITFYGIGGISAAAIGTLFHDVRYIAAAVTMFYVLFAIVSLIFLMPVQVSMRRLAGNLLPPLGLNLLLWLCAGRMTQIVAVGKSNELRYLLVIGVLTLMLAITNGIFFRNEWRELLRIPLRRFSRVPVLPPV